jgi:hypothetical protein
VQAKITIYMDLLEYISYGREREREREGKREMFE